MSHFILPDRALLIRPTWVERILHDNKRWEMRSRATHIRGRIALASSGTGTLVGECRLVDCILPTHEELVANHRLHQVDDLSILSKWRYAWVLDDIIHYEQPLTYTHPQGAVIWVNL